MELLSNKIDDKTTDFKDFPLTVSSKNNQVKTGRDKTVFR